MENKTCIVCSKEITRSLPMDIENGRALCGPHFKVFEEEKRKLLELLGDQESNCHEKTIIELALQKTIRNLGFYVEKSKYAILKLPYGKYTVDLKALFSANVWMKNKNVILEELNQCDWNYISPHITKIERDKRIDLEGYLWDLRGNLKVGELDIIED